MIVIPETVIKLIRNLGVKDGRTARVTKSVGELGTGERQGLTEGGGGGGHSGTEGGGGRTRVTYFAEECFFLIPPLVRDFVKEGFFFVPRYEAGE